MRKIVGCTAAVTLLVLTVSLAGANPDITELASADDCSGVHFIAEHTDGSEQTSVSILGQLPGPPTSGLMVSDTAWALDGNRVEAEWATPSQDTEWRVKMRWQLRGMVRPITWHAEPETSYWGYVDCTVVVADESNNNNWPALNSFENERAQIVNEDMIHKADAIVFLNETVLDTGEVSFKYEVELGAYAQLDRAGMSIECRGELFGEPTFNEETELVNNLGFIRLVDTVTGDPLVELTLFE